MGNNTVITVYDIARQFLFALSFLGAAAVSFLVIREEKVKGWLEGGSKLLHIVVFLSLSYLVYSSVTYFLSNLLYFPRRLITGDILDATINCLTGLLVLAGLIVGSIMILKNKGIK
jgi:hypothetical protein